MDKNATKWAKNYNKNEYHNLGNERLKKILMSVWQGPRGPSHLMFSFLLQILKLGGGHFSLFIIFARIRT